VHQSAALLAAHRDETRVSLRPRERPDVHGQTSPAAPPIGDRGDHSALTPLPPQRHFCRPVPREAAAQFPHAACSRNVSVTHCRSDGLPITSAKARVPCPSQAGSRGQNRPSRAGRRAVIGSSGCDAEGTPCAESHSVSHHDSKSSYQRKTTRCPAGCPISGPW
jgi:hypothetical protein